MILKFKDFQIDGNVGWTFVDGIESASVFYDKELKTNCVTVFMDKNGEGCVYPVNDVAYLLNDNGKTIECVHGKMIDEVLEEMRTPTSESK